MNPARGLLLLILSAVTLAAQTSTVPATTAADGDELPPFYCPMDVGERSYIGGKCPKCGMAMVLGIPEAIEYRVELSVHPPRVVPGETVELQFEILEPYHDHRVTDFQVVHDKKFHLLFVHHELEIFRHEHPLLGDDGIFRLYTQFPKPGVYRLLADFYPAGSTPQMVPVTVTTEGFDDSLEVSLPRLKADLATKTGDNLAISLRTEPPAPIAGFKTLLFFTLDTAEGLEKFLGAWAHMLAVSGDLVDMVHAHPAIADGGPRIQMNVIFPRPGMYRVWIQTQRNGRVNTIPFTVPVKELQ